ncbi:hypothetical protein EXIGLDRAFT_187260 [Exidia glandulosa HHB12029]|uniref:Uncharacterized protein n=1 Tax=Exidia glandulosa HHB12029 TaxID=1314781 RepID=A0A165EYB0_EXIGL|nr:hypothetical protein EXIGLDRAFT_187260 [Exidia glandulosa HHB12029]
MISATSRPLAQTGEMSWITDAVPRIGFPVPWPVPYQGFDSCALGFCTVHRIEVDFGVDRTQKDGTSTAALQNRCPPTCLGRRRLRSSRPEVCHWCHSQEHGDSMPEFVQSRALSNETSWEARVRYPGSRTTHKYLPGTTGRTIRCPAFRWKGGQYRQTTRPSDKSAAHRTLNMIVAFAEKTPVGDAELVTYSMSRVWSQCRQDSTSTKQKQGMQLSTGLGVSTGSKCGWFVSRSQFAQDAPPKVVFGDKRKM